MKTRIEPAFFCIAVPICLLLAFSAQAFAQKRTGRKAQEQNACAQVTNACKAAGFTAGGGKGGRLRKDCVEPILQGQSQSAQSGRALPSVDPAVVDACRSGQSSAVTTAITAPPSPTPGGSHVQLPPIVINNSDGLRMSEPQPVLTGQSIGGMSEMPDQQTPIFQANGQYKLYVTGVDYVLQGGMVSVFTTPDLANPSLYQATGPVLIPPYKKSGSCDSANGDACAAYVGMEAVFETGKPGNLVGFYIADQKTVANSQQCTTGFWGQLMVGTSTDGGNSWSAGQPTLRATPLPTTCPNGIAGFNQPTVIRIGNQYYLYSGTPTIKGQGTGVARAAVGANGLPGPWAILSNGQWTPVPSVNGVQTIGNNADIVVQGSGGMPWVSFNKYLQTYLMTLITHDGFYYSKLEKSNPNGKPTQADLDAQKWTAPQIFEAVPGGQNWKSCAITWENLSFVTPGFADNHTTGKSGYVVLSIMPGWGCPQKGPRSLALASYAFGVRKPPPPPVVKGPSPAPPPRPAPCRSNQPCQK